MKESFRIRVAKLGMDILKGWIFEGVFQTFFELDFLK